MTLILASKSASRRAMLEAAGVAFTSEAAAVDERSVEAALEGAAPAEVALALAVAKALSVPPGDAENLVLGSDSLVVCNGRRFDKPTDREEAARHLALFSGQTIELHSAAALARHGKLVWGAGSTACLAVRTLSPAFIESYLDAEWPAVAGCVGVFRIEARGVQLFHRIDGDYFTILGMPLLLVLEALRDLGELPA